jgi:uncharacterized protein YwqG
VAKASDRRRFFTELLRSSAQAASQAGSVLRAGGELVSAGDPDFRLDNRVARGEPVRQQVSLQEFLALCKDVGLSEHRAAAAQELIRPSLRLTRGGSGTAGPSASRLGGAPDLPPGFEWPRWRGRELAFLGQLDLAAVAGHIPEAELPAGGLVLFFYDAVRKPSGLEPSHAGSCRVLVAAEGQPLEPAPRERAAFRPCPLVLSRELTLPPAHSFQLDPLDLDATEFAAWGLLRLRLAEHQGVVLEEHSPGPLALHRLLGHAEPVYGREMELDCQLTANGLDLSEGEGYADPKRDELEPGAAEWRLLLQLSSDPELGWVWSEPFGRFYVWIRLDDLLAGEFDRVWAIRQ